MKRCVLLNKLLIVFAFFSLVLLSSVLGANINCVDERYVKISNMTIGTSALSYFNHYRVSNEISFDRPSCTAGAELGYDIEYIKCVSTSGLSFREARFNGDFFEEKEKKKMIAGENKFAARIYVSSENDKDADSWSGEDPSNCFTSDQLVNLANGEYKRFDELQIGDIAKVYNEKEKSIEEASINNIKEIYSDEVYELYLANGKVLKPTASHPFLTKSKGWASISGKDEYGIDSNKLEIGDIVFSLNKEGNLEEVEVINIVSIEGQFLVYNLVNMKYNTFLADGIVVHNDPPGKDADCFMPDQLINLANGSYKRIDSVVVGDIVKVYNEELNLIEEAPVKIIKKVYHDNVYELYLSNGKVLKPTANHPFLTKGKGWATISGLDESEIGSDILEVGDVIYSLNENGNLDEVFVEKIMPINGNYLTYNLIDMKYGTFLVDDIIVHNSAMGTGDSGDLGGRRESDHDSSDSGIYSSLTRSTAKAQCLLKVYGGSRGEWNSNPDIVVWNGTEDDFTAENMDNERFLDDDEVSIINCSSNPDSFLWKPESEQDGNLIVMLPLSYGNECNISIGSKEPSLVDIYEDGRSVYRFSKPGLEYAENEFVISGCIDADSGFVPNRSEYRYCSLMDFGLNDTGSLNPEAVLLEQKKKECNESDFTWYNSECYENSSVLCKYEPEYCDNELDCEEERWNWWDDKCNFFTEPPCSIEQPFRCYTSSECNSAGGLYWDVQNNNCTPCLSECLSGTSLTDPLRGRCCINKCSPKEEVELIGISDSCIENDERRIIHYKYYCNGVSGNVVRTENGTCDGIAELKVFYEGAITDRLVYGKDYDLKLYFDNEVSTYMVPILYIGFDGVIMEDMYFVDCSKREGASRGKDIYCADSTSIYVKGLEGEVSLEIEAKTKHNEDFELNSQSMIIDTVPLKRPKLSTKRIK